MKNTHLRCRGCNCEMFLFAVDPRGAQYLKCKCFDRGLGKPMPATGTVDGIVPCWIFHDNQLFRCLTYSEVIPE